MRRLLLVAVLPLLMAASCPPSPSPGPVPTPTPPQPTPTPTPPTEAPKGVPIAVNMLIRQVGGHRLQTLDGQTWKPFQAISCCMTEPEDVLPPPERSMWPLINEQGMAFYQQYGANWGHWRLGPFYADDPGESDWAHIGGPYLSARPVGSQRSQASARYLGRIPNSAKSADETPGPRIYARTGVAPNAELAWNQAFWDRARKALYWGSQNNFWVEIAIIDTWQCKHASSDWGDVQIPWPQADIEACGRRASPEQERFLRKAVSEYGCYGNVLWVDSNEPAEIRGYSPEWSSWVQSIIRDEEQKSGCGFVHMFGTNATGTDAVNRFDYVQDHGCDDIALIAERFSSNNERNCGRTPQQEIASFRRAREQGLHWAFWRAELTEQQMYQTLEGYKAIVDVDVPAGCYPPPENDPQWVYVSPGGGISSQVRDAYEAAKAHVGNRCGADPPTTLELLGERMRAQGFCAGKQADALFVWDEHIDTPAWKEIHAVAYSTGCYTTDPAQVPKSTYRHPVTPKPPAPPQCGNPVPPTVMEWSVKEHTKGPNKTVVDSTPLVGPASYCTAIGFTDGRSRCPVRQEGATDRQDCEAHAVGAPFWSGNGSISPENPYQYWVPRGTGGTVTVCASKAPNVCGSVSVAP